MDKIQKKRKKKLLTIMLFCLLIVLIAGILGVSWRFIKRMSWKEPEELIVEYMGYLSDKKYENMYEMISVKESGDIDKETFIQRNSNIYEGIEAKNIHIDIIDTNDRENGVTYKCSLDSVAGTIEFENTAYFTEEKNGLKLIWEDSLIFPQLGPEDKVQVLTESAQRGKILDRNGRVLAGKGIACSVGVVPGKMENSEDTIRRLAEALEIEEKTIKEKLSASWVKEDSFVPIKTIQKEGMPDVTDMLLGEAFYEEGDLEKELLEIPGVMLTDTEVRSYPLKEAASHLVGYVQAVTAEDLEEHVGEGYSSGSVIGRSGIEGLYEKELKGRDGYKILIKDKNGNNKVLLAMSEVQHGKDIQLTIDANLQEMLYEQFQEDKSCSVALNPVTGEVLALVSTPSYDNNDFIIGMSDEQWTELNEDEDMPLYNRFRQTWCPGSSLKPIIAAIGLDCGAIDPDEDYGNVGLSWQKDETWGNYYVTTLHSYEPVILQNALIYSDNIYFAKAALKIGAEQLENAFDRLGFGEAVPFAITMSASQYANNGKIETEVQLADSGYGQGQILINPLHLAALYTGFCNQGNILAPSLLYKENPEKNIWLSQAFSAETANTVLEGLKQVINDPNGTGYGLHREDIVLAGKTGTAEIKATVEDTTGTELGWMAVFTTDENMETPVLIVSMVEDVKERGGSGYVVEKERNILEEYLK